MRPRRRWEYSEGKPTACSQEPVAMYTVSEIARKGKPPRYIAYVLTEVGPECFSQEFRTMAAAQRFCEDDVDRWREEINQNRAGRDARQMKEDER